ncbi:MAG: WXG100 family type VII secretion target [Clostridiales bacterium]|nr:WXG100 family type VII secretion target [Clostridiales bacterium]
MDRGRSWLDAGTFLGSLTVEPELLRQKSEAVLQKVKGMKVSFTELETAVARTGGYWNGESADAHREYFEQQRPRMEEMLARLMEHVQDLNQMAAVYSRGEQEAKEISLDLPSDVIV